MRLQPALDAERERVEVLQKQTGELQKTLRRWHKACLEGTLPARQRAADQAVQQARELPEPIADTAAAWAFDLDQYLASGDWREELHDVAADNDLAVHEEQEYLISSPVTVRAVSARGALQIGRRQWSKLHPRIVVKELLRLREGNQLRNASETLEALYGVWKHEDRPQLLKFRAVYDMFSLTPGWKRENPLIAFAQRLHALHRARESEQLRTTRDGRPFHFEWPSGDPRQRDLVTFVAENGRPISYYGLHFD